MLWLERGNIVKRWLNLTCHVISMAQIEMRNMLVTVFHKKNKAIRDSFRLVVQNLCNKHHSGVDKIMYADLPVPCGEEVPYEEERLGFLGDTVQL